MKRQLIPLIFIIAVAGCTSSPEEKETEKPYCLEDFKSDVEWINPEYREVTEEIHLTGEVEANPDKVVHYISLISGFVSNTFFSLGDEVKKGQILAEIKSAELSEMQLQANSIHEQIKIAQRKLESVQSMFDDGIASQKELIEAQSELNILKAERDKVNANLNLYSGNFAKGNFQIKAPVAGIITSKNIASGSPIQSDSEALFTISDLSEVWIMINVYATNVEHVRTGMEVRIKTLSYPDEVFTGKISMVSHVLDDDAKVLKARIVLPNKDARLKPGMLVDVMIRNDKQMTAMSLPLSSLVFDENEHYVVVYHDDCQLEVRKLDILSKNSDYVFLSGKLNENEKIISKNQLLIYEQVKNF